MQYSSIFWSTILWLIFWGVVGGVITRRVYLRKDLDTSNAILGGSLIGASFGPIGLVPLWWKSPEISRVMILLSSLVMVGSVSCLSCLTFQCGTCPESCFRVTCPVWHALNLQSFRPHALRRLRPCHTTTIGGFRVFANVVDLPLAEHGQR